jgi:CubicO group peptidase (beta-lactamase class C family)
MAILLASEIAQRISGIEFREFVARVILQPLGMVHSAFGTGQLQPDDMMPCQVEFGAIESGGGSADSRGWDWNSSYWRNLGAPWGGAQASAKDVAIFLEEFLHPTGKILRPEVAKLMIQNHNPVGLVPRGLGLDVGMNDVFPEVSLKTFGHTGSTGTIAWADPERDCVCVVLTTLPADATQEHPRQLVSRCIAAY